MVRQEGSTIRRYCHIGTGNYNPKTARLYEDIGLLTADPTIGADLTDLFNSLTGYSRQTSYQQPARGALRRAARDRASASSDEIEAHREGKDARIRIKVNALVDEQVIDALYRASQAGVPVDVVVRGICAHPARACRGSARTSTCARSSGASSSTRGSSTSAPPTSTGSAAPT